MRRFFLALSALLCISMFAAAQNKTVTGKVTEDKTGNPMPGANVQLRGTNSTVKTGADGMFSITVPQNARSLTVTYSGYIAEDVDISGKNTVAVTLTPLGQKGDEVVVVAYGTVKKENFTGSANKIKGSDIAERPLTNAVSALVGAAPGVQTNAGSGQPGAAPAVRIRGFGSVSASSDPLYVVDGVPFSGAIGNLNPNDIEDMSVLKDASSTALYGARAANGVVMITTRRGKKGSKPSINLSYNTGTSDRAIAEYDRVGVNDYYPLMWQALRNNLVYRATSPLTPAAAATQATNTISTLLTYNPYNVAANTIVGTDGRLNPNAQLLYKPEDLDWEKSIRRLGQRQDMNMNISGAQDRTDYFISLGYLKEKGYIIRSDFERITGRINVNTQAAPWLKAGLNINGTFTKSNLASSTGTTAFVNPFNFTRGIGPIYPVYAYVPGTSNYLLDALGNRQYDYGNLSALGLANRPGGGYGGRHITAETQLNREDFRRNFWGARTYAEFTFLKDFKFTTNISVDVTNRKDLSYGNTLVGDASPAGSLSISTDLTTNYNWNQLLTYKKNIKKHSFDVLAGHENYDLLDENFNASRTVQIVQGIYELVNFSTPGTSRSVADRYRVEGFLSRLNYDYDNKYYATMSFRRDGSSKFDSEKRWGNFWSASGAWRLDRENFLAGSRVISALKLRASYGQTGNDAGISFYASQPLFTLGFNNAFEPGTILSSLGNKDLEWEASKQTDVALEFGLFKNRITGTIEWFNRVSDNLIFAVPLPLSSGISSQTRNVGSMYNRGIELQLSADVVRYKEFNWNVIFNYTQLKNRITKLPQEEIISGTKKLKVGQSIFDYWLRDWRGVDATDGAALYTATNGTATGSRVVKAGDTLTINQNNGKFNYQGSSIPDFYGSITSAFTYKGLELSALLTYQVGGKVYDVTYAGLMDPGNYGAAAHADLLNAWKNPGDVTEIPRMDAGQRGISNAASARWLTDASFLNFRNVTLAYTFSNNVLNRLKIRTMRFNITGENLYILTKRRGMNVEESFTGVTSQAFIPSRIISAGVNITF